EEADAEVGRLVALPGTSGHQTGLAVDVGSTKEGHQWLANNGWKYGFILRYPEGKEEITGLDYEPWHFRYVGKELAKEIYDSGLCLEEYLEMMKDKAL
ncbi:MAG: M15 family metallopeptidase, partial [Oscillospiraceae bacterium]|nr:M15 family metallopeptidase [Oscillospiraceae bacterium]